MNNIILKIRNKISYNILLSVALFGVMFIFHGPRFGSIDTSVISAFVIGAPYLLYLFLNKTSLSIFERYFIFIIMYAFIVFFIEGLSNFSHNGHYFFRVSRSAFVYLSFFSFHIFLGIKLKDLLMCCFFALATHLALTYCQYFTSGDLKNFFLHFNTLFTPEMNPSEHKNMVLSGIRVRGLMKGFDTAGIMIAFLAQFALYYIRSNFLKIFLIVVAFIGTLITSRVGLVTLSFILFLHIPYLYYIYSFRRFSIYIISLISILISSIFITYNFFPNSQLYKKSFGRAFDTYYSYVNSNKIESTSLSDTYNNHLTLKNIESKKILFFGKASKQEPMTSNDPNSLNKLTSDVGYIQILYNFGFINLIIFIIFHLYLILLLMKQRTRDSYQFIAIVITVLFVSIKGPYFFSRGVYDFVILAFFYQRVTSQSHLIKP